MKEIKYTILYCVCENLCDSILYGSGTVSGTVINYGSDSDFLACYGSGSACQKVKVPTVPVSVPIPVPQCWLRLSLRTNISIYDLKETRNFWARNTFRLLQCCGSRFKEVPESASGSRRASQKNRKKVNKFHFLKCWIFSI
jgi:hypothetical protein